MDFSTLFTFLRKNPLFSSLSEEELRSLIPFFTQIHFKKGDYLLKEGEKSEHIFLLYKGKTEIVRQDPELREPQKICSLKSGDWVGEMAHFEKMPRSASVLAIEEGTHFLFNLEELKKTAHLTSVYSKIAVELAGQISRRLRETNDSFLESLKEKLKFAQSMNQTSKTIIYFFIGIALWLNCYKLIDMFPKNRFYADQFFTVLFVILGGIGAFAVIKSSGYPLSFYGLTLKDWKRHILESVFYSLPVLGFILVLKWVLITHVKAFEHLPLISPPTASGLTWESFIVITVAYLILIPVQELTARGALQSCLRNFFQGPDRVIVSILVSNVVFLILHTVKDFWLGIATFILGVFWGFMYEHQKSLVGVSFSHILIGAWTFSILDFQSLMSVKP